MKYLLILIIAFFSLDVLSQDLIIYNDGSEEITKVNKITDDKIFFKKYSNLNGPTYSKYKDEVFMIRYQNGTKDVFNLDVKDKSSSGHNNTVTKNKPQNDLCQHTNSEIAMSNSKYVWQCVDCKYIIKYATQSDVTQYLSNNNKLNNSEIKIPCGPKPSKPPSFNNPQFKSSKRYKDYLKKLKKWEDCRQ